MNFDFSIESSIAKIHNPNTKEYFKEVYQTFVNGNYRSSVVMLYSVLICDLVYKLRDLRDIYNDPKAKKILEEITAMQIKNPKSPEWESKLIEFINDRTSLLEPSDSITISTLQNFRHLSAHPVLSDSDLLYSPNKDVVQALIRNILDGILTNPPFFSSKIFDTMLLDLADVKEKLPEDESLQKYIHARYLKGLKETDFGKIFRSLWKIVFISEEPDADANRIINYRALKILVKHDKEGCLNLVRKEPHFYSKIQKEWAVQGTIRFLAQYPEFYPLFEASLQLLIKSEAEDSTDLELVAWFLHPSLPEHLTTLDPGEVAGITAKTFKFMRKLCEENHCAKELFDFAIEYFGMSDSYATTKSRYKNAIENIAEHFSPKQIKRLLEISQNNSQIYYCLGMPNAIKQIAQKHIDDIDKSLYSRIFEEE